MHFSVDIALVIKEIFMPSEARTGPSHLKSKTLKVTRVKGKRPNRQKKRDGLYILSLKILQVERAPPFYILDCLPF